MDQSFVVARWDRPLVELGFHRGQSRPPVADEDLSWSRDDGWQCFAPEDFYETGMLPLVEEIEAQTGGPALGLAVEDSDSWHIAFAQDGRLRWLGRGNLEDARPPIVHEQMIDAWGEHWLKAAATSLHRWARPIADVSYRALWLALATPQLFAEETLFDVLRLLTLVEDAEEPPWWTTTIPGAEYAVHARDLSLSGAGRPDDAWHRNDLALAGVPTGIGVWSIQRECWAMEPTKSLTAVLTGLSALLREQGWNFPET